MDITITNNPYQNNLVLSDGTSRVAKLNNDTKRPHIANYWVLNMPKLKEESQKIEESVGNKEHSYDIVLTRLAMTAEFFDHYANISGFRKLKVNGIVRDRTLKAYESSTKVEVEKPIVMQEEVSMPPREEVIQNKSDLPNSRTARLEKTVEMPQVTTSSFKAPDDYRDILNDNQPQREEKTSLSRVGRRQNIDDYSNIDSHPSDKVQVGREAQALDRIATLSPLSQNGNKVDADLQEAYSKYAESERRKQNSMATIEELEREIRETKKLLEEKHKKEIADLDARTKANDEETLGNTIHSEDLRLELEELRNKLNNGGIRR